MKDNKLTKIPEDEIRSVVESFYNEKESDLKKFIRNTMRKNFPDYDKNLAENTGTEEIIFRNI